MTLPQLHRFSGTRYAAPAATDSSARYRSSLAILGVLLAGVLLMPLSAAAQGATSAPTAEQYGKMTAPVDIEWLAPGGPQSGRSFQAAIEVSAPVEPLSDVVVRVTPGSGVALTRPVELRIGDLARGESRRVEVPLAAASAGEGEVRAQVTAQSARGTIRRLDVLYAVVGADETVATRGSFVVARQEQLRYAFESGRMSPAAAEAARRAVRQTTGQATVTRTTGAGANRGESVPVTVSGTIQYEDRNGNLRPSRLMNVEVYDDQVDGDPNDDLLLGTAVTAADGTYSFTYNSTGANDLYVSVLASSQGFYIVPPGASNDDIRPESETYSARSPAQSGVTANATIDLDVSNATVPGNALSAADALVESSQYVNTVRGDFLPLLPVVFGGDGSYFNGTALFILLLDRYDWDVMHHEYGHYVMEQIGIQDNPGGEHSSGTNLAEIHGKDIGTRLAWGEGWPTYFGTSLQQVRNAAALNIPTAGDLLYTDTEDGELEYSLESFEGGDGLGEDDELSVQRILWDLYDAADDEGDAVTLGDQLIWDTLVGASPFTLSAAWNALIASRTVTDQVAFGSILATHQVAPIPAAPADETEVTLTDPPATFTWDPQGAGPSFQLNQFTVEFYSEDLSTLLYTSPQITAPTYTPTVAAWTDDIFGTTSRVKWIIRGANTAAPLTGTYASRASLLTAAPPVAAAQFTITTAGAYILAPPAADFTVDDLAGFNLVIGVPGYNPGRTRNILSAVNGNGQFVEGVRTGDTLPIGHGFRWVVTGADRDYGNGSISRPFPTTLSEAAPNTADVTLDLQTALRAVNVYGNPFGVPLDISGIASWPGGSKVSPNVFTWDATALRWIYDAGVTQVAPWQAFIVRTLAGQTGTLTIPASAAVGSEAWAATDRTKRDTPLGVLRFDLDGTALDGVALSDGAFALTVGDEASAEPKLMPLSTAYVTASFGTADGLLSVEAMREGGRSREIPVVISSVGATPSLTLRWDAPRDLPAGWAMTLVDRQTGATADLSRAGRYAFEATSAAPLDAVSEDLLATRSAADTERFVLRIDTGDGILGSQQTFDLALATPSPNPTSQMARVPFTLAEAGAVSMTVIDALGRQVATLVDGEREAGAHAVMFQTRGLAAGLYVIRMEAGGQVMTQRVTVIR